MAGDNKCSIAFGQQEDINDLVFLRECQSKRNVSYIMWYWKEWVTCDEISNGYGWLCLVHWIMGKRAYRYNTEPAILLVAHFKLACFAAGPRIA